jgi:hypothetical protein
MEIPTYLYESKKVCPPPPPGHRPRVMKCMGVQPGHEPRTAPDGLLKKKSLRPELRTTTAMAKSKSRLSSRRAALNSAISAKPRALEGKLTHLTNYPCQTKNYAARACSRLDGIIYGLLTIATKRSRENAYALLRPTNYMFLNLIVCYYSH